MANPARKTASCSMENPRSIPSSIRSARSGLLCPQSAEPLPCGLEHGLIVPELLLFRV